MVNDTINNSRSKNTVIIILVIALLAVLGYLVYDQFFVSLKENVNDKEDNSSDIVSLDINSRLVETLYNKVVDFDGSTSGTYNDYFWLYPDMYQDFYVDEATEEEKMNFVGMNLNENKAQYVSCDDITVNTIETESNITYYSVCYNNTLWNTHNSQIGYSREYVETVYQDLFGKDAVLDTELYISPNKYSQPRYYYDESLDMYVEYMMDGAGGTSGLSFTSKVTRAEQDNNTKEVRIYETLTREEGVTGIEPEYQFVYIFKQEDDGMYTFVSRTLV